MKRTCKQICSLVLALCMVLTMLPMTAQAADGDIIINETNFPDANFREWLKTQTYGSDSVLTEEEIASIKRMNVSNSNITSLAGLEHFTALELLECQSNMLTTLPDLPDSLTYLDCSNNSLTELLELPNSLINLNCSFNKLAKLPDVLPTGLTSLDCSINKLTKLPELPESLTELDCRENRLTTLKLNESAKYTFINVRENLMKDQNAVTGQTIIWNTDEFKFVFGSQREDITAHFTDSNFLAVVREALEKDADDPIYDTDVASIAILNVSGKGIESLAGLEYFSALQSLDCSDNKLTDLPELRYTLTSLDCSNNMLTYLPELRYTLTSLDCSNNMLTYLPELQSALTSLDCSNNNLTTLTLNSEVTYTYIDVRNNLMIHPNAVKGKKIAWRSADGKSGDANFLYYQQRTPEGKVPTITSDGSTAFTVGTAGSFTVTASDSPDFFTVSGTLPTGLTFDSATGVLSGTPAAGTADTYSLTFTATNIVGTSTEQPFTLTVNPSISVTGTMNIGGEIDVWLNDGAKSGTGWAWNASTATLTLDSGYKNQPIAIYCANTDTINLVYTENVFISSDTYIPIFCYGNLYINEIGSGGTLTLNHTGSDGLYHALEVYGEITIGSGTLNATSAGSARDPWPAFVIYANKGITITGSANVTVTATGAVSHGIMTYLDGGITISTSGTVTANGTGTLYALAASSSTDNINILSGTVTLSNSDTPDNLYYGVLKHTGGTLNGNPPTSAPSSNADLESLTVSVGTLSPAFNPSVTSYRVSVANSTTSITIGARAVSGAAISVSGAAISGGHIHAIHALNVGANTISMVVTYGVTTKTYTVTITRGASSGSGDNSGGDNSGGDNSGGGNNSGGGGSSDNGTPTPGFTPTPTPSITPNPTPAPTATLTENLGGSKGNLTMNIYENEEDNSLDITIDLPLDDILEATGANTTDGVPELSIPVSSEGLLEYIRKSDAQDVKIRLTIPASLSDHENINISNIGLNQELLAAAKEEGKDITVSVADESGREQYSWTFEGSNLAASDNEITQVNLALTVNAIGDSELAELLGEDGASEEVAGLVISFGHEGVLPSQASVRIYVGNQDKVEPGDRIYLYYYNPETGKLDTLPYSSGYRVDKDGYITVDILHCSDYLVLPRESDAKLITSLRKQIKVTVDKTKLTAKDNKKKTAQITVELPVTLELVENLGDKTSNPARGGVTVTFRCPNTKVATVDEYGVITAKKKGVALVHTKITLYSGKTKTVTTRIKVD